jgi:hypothetical protein
VMKGEVGNEGDEQAVSVAIIAADNQLDACWWRIC